LYKQGSESNGLKKNSPIRHSLQKSEILRKRELFKRVALTGKRLNGRLLRCTYLLHDESKAVLQIGFKVPSTRKGLSENLKAVRRNRLRRLMREAFSREISMLYSSLAMSSNHMGIIVFFRGCKDVAAERVTLAQVQEDVKMFCESIVSSVRAKTS
jgi:ribonuclease P protein component